MGDSTEQVSPSNALSPSFEAHCGYLIFVTRTHRSDEAVTRRSCACARSWQRANADAETHHATKLDATSTRMGSTESCEISTSKFINAQNSASDNVRANPLKQFVVFCVMTLKQVIRVQMARSVHRNHLWFAVTYFSAGGFGSRVTSHSDFQIYQTPTGSCCRAIE